MKVLMVFLTVLAIGVLQTAIEYGVIDLLFDYSKMASLEGYAIIFSLVAILLAAGQYARRRSSIAVREYYGIMKWWLMVTLLAEFLYIIQKSVQIYFSFGRQEFFQALPGIIVILVVITALQTIAIVCVRRRQSLLVVTSG